ncbi:MAG TPA: urate hydroxylase PuuD [Steroidobacteraceae bacterium]|nr:urate hydroxylase PuuD [Steroidobacteraceae bacterium]
MTTAYVLDWLNLTLRWAHVITGIAWIGSSFYFIWLDLRLNVPPRDPENPEVAGDLWAVHGGGFYHAQKYKLAPASLPEPLHWFKWEAYFTWITGFLLFAIVYYANAGALLVDPAVADIGDSGAIAASLLLLPIGWFVYDGLCRLARGATAFLVLGLVLLLALCFGLAQLFAGRGAFLQAGVMLGTIMAANVWRVIIPAQKALVAAKQRGEAPDPALGLRAKQRSVHNNYLTLPVVFTMISPHFALLYAHEYNWLVLFLVFLAGAFVRHWFNLRNQGRQGIGWLAATLAIGAGIAIALAPRAPAAGSATFAEANRVIQARCVACHSASTTHPSAPVAAAGVMLDTPREIAAWAARIHERAVVTRTMPLANLTGMTEAERALLAGWIAAGAPAE